MADNFKALVKEQKETNKKLDQLVKAADPAGSAAAEDKKDKITADTKRTNLLRKMAGGITDLAKGWKDAAKAKLKGLGGGLIKFLKATALAGMMVALLAFLESDTWKKMKENIATFLSDPSLKSFFKIFAPVGKWSIIAAIAGLALLFAPIRTTMMVGGLLFKGIKGLVGMFAKKGIINRGIGRLSGMLSGAFGTGGAVSKTELDKHGKPLKGATLQSRMDKKSRAGRAGGGGLAKVGKGVLRGARFLGPIGLAITGIMGVIDGVTAGMEEAKKKNSTALTVMREASAGVISGFTFGLISQETISKSFTSIGDKFDSLTTGVTDAASKAWTNVKDLIPTEKTLKTAYTDLKDKVAGITTGVKDAAVKAYTTVKNLIPSEEKLTKAYTDLKNQVTDITTGVKDTAVKAYESVKALIPTEKTLTTAYTGLKDKVAGITTSVTTAASKAWAAVKDLIPTEEKLKVAYIGIKDKVSGITTSVTNAASKAWTAVKDLIPTEEKLKVAYIGIKNYAAGITTSVTNAASKAWTAVKDLIPTEQKLKEKFTTLKDDLAPLLEIKLPTEFTFAGIGASVTSMANALNTSFANITGIDIKAKMEKIKTGVAAKATALVASFENITGLTVPSFTEAKAAAQKTLTDIGTNVSTKFTELTGLTMPTFGDIQGKLNTLGTNVSASFKKLTGITIPSFDEIGAKLSGMLPDIKNPLTSLAEALRTHSSTGGLLDKWMIRDVAKKMAKVIDGIARQAGGPISRGLPYLVGEMGPELIFPSGSGQVYNAQRTEQILASGINRNMQGMGGGSPTLVNAPVNTVNNSQSNTTVTSTELKHPSPLLASVNLAA